MPSKYTPVSTAEAAARLGVSARRIRALIAAPCPACQGQGTTVGVGRCGRCLGSGRRLPAFKLGDGPKAPWMVYGQRLDLPDLVDRPPGRPKHP